MNLLYHSVLGTQVKIIHLYVFNTQYHTNIHRHTHTHRIHTHRDTHKHTDIHKIDTHEDTKRHTQTYTNTALCHIHKSIAVLNDLVPVLSET